MISKLSLLLCAIFAIVLVGCSKSDTNTNGSATNNSNKAATSSTTPASTTASTAGDKIGVPECDEYLTAYDACVSSKVPEAARSQYKTSIDQMRASWRKAAENPATKASLAAACKQATETARATMKSYGCTF